MMILASDAHLTQGLLSLKRLECLVMLPAPARLLCVLATVTVRIRAHCETRDLHGAGGHTDLHQVTGRLGVRHGTQVSLTLMAARKLRLRLTTVTICHLLTVCSLAAQAEALATGHSGNIVCHVQYMIVTE
jgi:hypothetical protein